MGVQGGFSAKMGTVGGTLGQAGTKRANQVDGSVEGLKASNFAT